MVAYEGSGKGFLGIQVKTLSKRDPVPLSTSLEKITGDYWVIVTNVATAIPRPEQFGRIRRGAGCLLKPKQTPPEGP